MKDGKQIFECFSNFKSHILGESIQLHFLVIQKTLQKQHEQKTCWKFKFFQIFRTFQLKKILNFFKKQAK